MWFLTERPTVALHIQTVVNVRYMKLEKAKGPWSSQAHIQCIK